MAFYPSPMGTTESSVELDTWHEVETANPLLGDMEPDVEALLVNRSRGAREHWLVPVDDCYRLVAVVRTHWRGFTGGQKVWEEIGEFFGRLNETGKGVRRQSGTTRSRSVTFRTDARLPSALRG